MTLAALVFLEGGRRMHRRVLTAGITLGLVTAIASGCGKSTTAPAPPGDPAQVSSTLAAAASLVEDGLAEDSTQVSVSGTFAGPASIQATIRPYMWWQRVTHETRTWDFAWADSDSTARPRTCIATLNKHMTGTLVIVPVSLADSTQPGTTHIIKPLDKTLTRRVMLKRLLIGGAREWKVVAITGAFVTTPGAQTRIQSLHLHSTSGVDTTVTDPLQFFALRHVVKFSSSDTVTVTATTLRTNDAVFIHRWDWRHRLRNNGDGTYSFTWITSTWGGWRHFGIQAMSHGSIYTDTLPFDSEAWHLPFRVVGGQPDVDYYP
jgi:hypothetical protein